MAPSVAISLVVYEHTDDEVSRTLDQWKSQTHRPSTAYLVANAPRQTLSGFVDRAIVLTPGRNLGFTGGANLAARSARDDGYTHLLLSNLDIAVLSPDIIVKLLGVFTAHSDCAFASPGIVMWPDTSRVWYRGARVLRPAWVARHPGIDHEWKKPSRGAVPTGYFSGCCVLIDVDKFLALGGFDESLFMYYDEADLAERASLRGWQSWLLDEPLLAHAKPGRELTEREAYWHARNSSVLLRRYEHGVRRAVGRAAQWGAMPLQLRRCDSRAARIAYLSGFRGRPLR